MASSLSKASPERELESFDAAAAAAAAAAQFKYIMFFHQGAVPLLLMMMTMTYADDGRYRLVDDADGDALVRPMSMERNEATY